MEIKGWMQRQGGQWKLMLCMEQWVIDDILRDCDRHDRVVITLMPDYPGASAYGNKAPKVVALASFDETNVEPKE